MVACANVPWAKERGNVMIAVAICDDNEKQLKTISALLAEYQALRPDVPMRMSRFSNGESLIACTKSVAFDLYILDVLMPGVNGIDVGLRLREMGAAGEIIYLSASRDFAVESYQAQAFFYLLKPVTSDQLFPVLDRVAVLLNRRRAEQILVHTPSGSERVMLQDILYVERVRRFMCYHCVGGKVVSSVSLRVSFHEAASSLLKHRCFLMCGASIVLNLRHVNAVEQGVAIMADATRVPIPRRLGAQIRRAWMDYWLEANAT